MLKLNRRGLVLSAAAALGGASASIGAAAAGTSRAATPWQPGFHRLRVGNVEVTVISDGQLRFSSQVLFGEHAGDAERLLASAFLPAAPVGLQLNTTLVRTGEKLILIDAGGGGDGKFQPTAGRLLGNLAGAGVAPRDIDIVLITHGHSDHLWGISDLHNEALLFPSAEIVASETEVKFWNAPELTAKVSPALKPDITRANLKLASPRLRLIKAGADVVSGVTTIDTPGHTPGHMSVLIHSGSEQLLVTADVVVNQPVDLLRPEWPFGFDQDEELAMKSRRAFLDRAATDRALVSGYHFPFPGIGHVARDGQGFRWVPADWQWDA